MRESYKAWSLFREAFADYSFAGLGATSGLVEGVLLAEFLPREKGGRSGSAELLGGGVGGSGEGLHGIENRRSWALTGLTIRAAYGLGCKYHFRQMKQANPHRYSGSGCAGDGCFRANSRGGKGEKCLDLVLCMISDNR